MKWQQMGDVPIRQLYDMVNRCKYSASDTYIVPRTELPSKHVQRKNVFTEHKSRIPSHERYRSPSPQDYSIPSYFRPQRSASKNPPHALKIRRYPFDLEAKLVKDNYPSPNSYFRGKPKEAFPKGNVKRQPSLQEKITYLTEIEVKSSLVPGPGFYEVQPPRSKVVKRKAEPSRKLKKDENHKRLDLNPLPVDKKLFASNDIWKKKPSFGKELRFGSCRRISSPGPSDYKIETSWLSKGHSLKIIGKPKARSLYIQT